MVFFLIAHFVSAMFLPASSAWSDERTINITSDSAVFDRKNQLTILTGNVIISMDSWHISASRIEVSGELGRFEKLHGRGKCRILNPDEGLVIIGDEFEFLREGEVFSIQGSPKIIMEGEGLEILAQEIEYRGLTRTISAKGDVALEWENFKVECGKAVYNEAEEKLFMTGTPCVRQAGSMFTSREICFDKRLDRLELNGDVKGVLKDVKYGTTEDGGRNKEL